MLTIRNAQMKAFHEASRERDITLLAEWLQANHPSAAGDLPPERVRDRVRLGLARAAVHGITLETGGLLPFLTLMFLAAPNFDDHPVVRRTLQDGSLPAGERVLALADRLAADHWREVDERWDEAMWERSMPTEPDES